MAEYINVNNINMPVEIEPVKTWDDLCKEMYHLAKSTTRHVGQFNIRMDYADYKIPEKVFLIYRDFIEEKKSKEKCQESMNLVRNLFQKGAGYDELQHVPES